MLLWPDGREMYVVAVFRESSLSIEPAGEAENIFASSTLSSLQGQRTGEILLWTTSSLASCDSLRELEALLFRKHLCMCLHASFARPAYAAAIGDAQVFEEAAYVTDYMSISRAPPK